MSNKILYLDIQNFQGYKRARIPLSNFTIFVGESFAGKSSMMRALQFLFYGEWDSTYVNDTTKPTAVAITLDTGTRIIRMRQDGLNQAAIISGGKTVKYKSFGDVIPGIESYINVRPIEIGNSSVNLNFSMQDDSVFMVNEARPTKAQWIGRLYGAHIVNEMLRNVAKDKKSLEGKRKDREQEIDKLSIELATYKTVEEQERILAEVGNSIETVKHLYSCKMDYDTIKAYRDQLGSDAWVMAVDIRAIKIELFELSRLHDLKDSLVKIDLMKRGLQLMTLGAHIDTKLLKSDIALLSTLRSIETARETVRREATENMINEKHVNDELLKTKDLIHDTITTLGVCPLCGVKNAI